MSDEQNESQQSELFPEYVPDYSDSTVWIRVHTPELIRLGRDAGNDEGREVLSGKMLVSYRKCTPEDGSAEVVIEKPVSKQTSTSEEKVEWPSWGQIVKVDPRLKRHDGPSGPSCFGGSGYRNRNVQRWNESAE